MNAEGVRSKTRVNPLRWIGLAIAGLVLIGLVVFGIPAIQGYINRVELRIESICRYQIVYETGAKYTPHELNEGCKRAVQNAKGVYDQEFLYCFNEYGQTDGRLSECLEEEGAYLTGEYEIMKMRGEVNLPSIPTVATIL